MSKLIILGANPKHLREHLYLISKFESVISFGNSPIEYIENHCKISVYNTIEIINKIEQIGTNDLKIFSRFTGDKLLVRYIIETYFDLQSTSYHIYKSAVDKTYMRLFFGKLNIPTTSISTHMTNSVIKPAISKIGKLGVKKIDTRQQFKNNYQSIVDTAENIDLNIENILEGRDYTVFVKYGTGVIKNWKVIEEHHEFKNADLIAVDYRVPLDTTVWENVKDYAMALAPYCVNQDVITLHFKYSESVGPIFYELGYGLGGDNFFENTEIFSEWEQWLEC